MLAETTRVEGCKGILPLSVCIRRFSKRACIFVVFGAPEGLFSAVCPLELAYLGLFGSKFA